MILYLKYVYKICTLPGMCILWLFYGFFIEWILVNTLYWPDILLKLYIALPWHMLITIVSWLYILPKVLSTWTFKENIRLFSLIGLLYTLWGFWWVELEWWDYLSWGNFIIYSWLSLFQLILWWLFVIWGSKKWKIEYTTTDRRNILLLIGIYLIIFWIDYIFEAVTFWILATMITITLLKRYRKLISEWCTEKSANLISIDWRKSMPIVLVPLVSSIGIYFLFESSFRDETLYLIAIPLWLLAYWLFIRSIALIYIYKNI